MINMSNKKKGAITGVAAIFVAATLAMFGISGEKIIEVDYSIHENGNVAEMTVDVPEEMEADIVELLCNDSTVTKTLMPGGKLKTIPFIFTKLENLELRFYKLGEVIGVGRFKDNKLYVAVKGTIGEVEADENE